MFRTTALIRLFVTLGIAFVLAGPGARGQAPPPRQATDADTILGQAIITAEDARAATPEGMQPIFEGLASRNADIQALAVRALGRLERLSLASRIVPLLSAPAARVRLEAAAALGQTAETARIGGVASAQADAKSDESPVGAIAAALLKRLRAERDPAVRGVIAETLGRLPYTADEVESIEGTLIDVAGHLQPPINLLQDDPAVTGAVKGLEAIIRLNVKQVPPSPGTLKRLQQVFMELRPRPGTPDGRARTRRMAVAALIASRKIDRSLVEAALADPDDEVRRLGANALVFDPAGQTDSEKSTLRGLFDRALADPSPMVRYEGLRVYGRRFQAADCAPVTAARADPNPHVSLLAIDLLGSPCPGGDAERLLATIADSLPSGDPAARGAQGGPAGGSWHAAAHAIVSLAKIGQPSARDRLPRFVSSPTWQVRMYAARAAELLKDTATLGRLVEDAHDNVRQAALSALSRLNGHGSDAVFIAALERDDYQLVRAAALALKGTPNRDRALPALLASLARLSAPGRQTSRDARMALLDRIEEIGSVEAGASLVSYGGDVDPAIATRANEVMRKLSPAPADMTARRATPAPPDFAQLAGADRQTVRVLMRGGRSFSLRLFVDDAPLSAIRFLALVRKGYYDGLTFHRVVPNFCVQGGSPGANEYAGDGPFMRDELGLLSNARGTVGISSRGRDTGDAQIYVNLADNFRLDHEYTVFGEVIEGMDVVDGILEGDTIEKVEIVKS